MTHDSITARRELLFEAGKLLSDIVPSLRVATIEAGDAGKQTRANHLGELTERASALAMKCSLSSMPDGAVTVLEGGGQMTAEDVVHAVGQAIRRIDVDTTGMRGDVADLVTGCRGISDAIEALSRAATVLGAPPEHESHALLHMALARLAEIDPQWVEDIYSSAE